MNIGKESSMSNEIKTPSGTSLFYLGPHVEEGMLPALFYFSLSGKESLELEPYNHVPQTLQKERMRTFSLTLPGHEEGRNKFHAMKYWAEQIKEGNYLIEEFLMQADEAIHWLIAEEIIDPLRIAVSGLSRGGLIAGLLASKNKNISTFVGFAPVVDLSVLEDFSDFRDNRRLWERLHPITLVSVIEQLTHLRHLRFYIATLDEKVNTDSCYHFIKEMSHKVHQKRAKHCYVELFLTPPLGYKGHGTAPHIFEEGAALIKRQLLR